MLIRYHFRISLTVLCIFSLIVVLAPSVFAGTTGKISGTITDAVSGEPIPGVNVVVQGTRMGSATDLDGYYNIIGIPPGSHVVIFSYVGYATQQLTNVRVTVDQTTHLNIELQPEVVSGEVVEFVAERPIIQADRTFSTASISNEDIEVMPITSTQEVIDLQAGVVDGHFRGGRAGEVVYMLDGIPIQDVYDNSRGSQVNDTVVEELQVITGAFNAEYGQAMSGVVNMVSREGGDTYSGSMGIHYGDYLTPHDDVFYNIDDVSPTAIQDYELSLSGPVPYFENASFFFNGRMEDNEGYIYGENRWALKHQLVETDTGIVALLEHGDGSAEPMNDNFQLYAFGKVTYYLSDKIKLHYSSLWDDRDYSEYDHDYKFTPTGDYQRFRNSRTNLAKLTYAVNSNMFTEFGYANTFTQYEHYTFEDFDDDRYVHDLYLDLEPAYSPNIGGTRLEHFRRFTNTHAFQGKLAWQVTPIHYLQSGFNFSMNELYYRSITPVHNELIDTLGYDFTSPSYIRWFPLIQDVSSIYHDHYVHNPVEASFYLQDKIELQTLVVNVGLRMDYFDPDAQVLSDPRDPNIYFPLLQERRNDTMEERRRYWYRDVDPKFQLSPRIGIGYPISSTGVLHFSYGHFFQRPRYEYLYTNPEFELEPGTGLNTVMGNADLEAERTISYEFGLQQGLTEDLSFGLTIFQRDIRSLVSSDEIIATYDAGTKYALYTNRDFGDIRGIILTLDKRYSNNISASINYTFQIAEGNASDPQDAYNASKGDKEPIKQLLPLDWDRRHTLNATVNYYVPDNWGGSLIGYLGSGLPYTTEEQGLATGFENDGRKPLYLNLDLNLFKIINIPSMPNVDFRIELMVRNVFDRLNENDVFRDTGRATYTELPERYLESPTISTFEEFFTHPNYYSRPREVRLGVSIRF